jgi:4-diphosphocytidyl-2-C-methyl-D-erythritol kinase
MICFPNAKINLGLQVALKREDGFHNLRSVFYPVPINDVLEIKKADRFLLTLWGDDIPQPVEQNLIVKAWELLSERYDIPPVEVQLIKNIPVGSGLGGGSSDASFFIKNIINLFDIKISTKELIKLTEQVCSDCPYFTIDQPAYVIGKGNVIEPLNFNLQSYHLVLIIPHESISTQNAFSLIKPKAPRYNLKKLVLTKDFSQWREQLSNDFESILSKDLLKIKNQLYDAGALYASLTGSGSAFYGIFANKPEKNLFKNHKVVFCQL